MALTVADALTRMDELLNDSTRVRWTAAMRQRYLLDAQRKIVDLVPGAGAVLAETLTLAAGIVQTAPATASGREVNRVMDVLCNVTVAGALSSGIRLAAKSQLDNQRPNWTAMAAVLAVKYWMPVDREPMRFYVYPPALSTSKVSTLLSVMPTSVDTIEVRHGYFDALVNYAMFRCFQKDDTENLSPQAQRYLDLFAAEMKAVESGDAASFAREHDRNKPK